MLSFSQLKKNLRSDFTGLKKCKVAILADSASQLLNVAIRGYGYQMGLDITIYEADFNQIDLQIFDPSSELYQFEPQFIFINRSTEKLLSDFYKKERNDQDVFSEYILQNTEAYYNTISAQLKAKVLINTYPEINDTVFGNFAAKTRSSFIYQLRKTNLCLMELAQQKKDMFVCDLASLQSDLGRGFVFDPKMYINANMVYSLDFLPYVAKHTIDIINSITGTFKKCLILDLDNTTWGGIIGDDGIENIQLGDLGIGKAFTGLQQWAKELKRRGIILAVCSKNTEAIAMEPFNSHPDMVLRPEDIAVFVANWETKVDNIRHIQRVLNIGFDSMVFIDDNPFEREIVKSAIPDICVPDLPEDPAEYLIYLRSLNLFETASFTEEDTNRTQQYQEEAKRNVLQHTFNNESDFLASLQMVADVKPFDRFSIPRVAQLTQRSNQFNLRTIRYTEEDLHQIARSEDHYTLSLSLKDRFGDNGLICVIILKKENETDLFIDSWIMSCRVLKRGMEDFTLSAIVDVAFLYNFERIIGEYLPTKKNEIVKDHFANLGFEFAGDKWILDIKNYKRKDNFITKKQ